MALLKGCIWLVVKEEGRICTYGALFGHCHTSLHHYYILPGNIIIIYIAIRLFQILHLYIMYIYIYDNYSYYTYTQIYLYY